MLDPVSIVAGAVADDMNRPAPRVTHAHAGPSDGDVPFWPYALGALTAILVLIFVAKAWVWLTTERCYYDGNLAAPSVCAAAASSNQSDPHPRVAHNGVKW